jgi:type I restriction-modification system DNA methylase subunit
MPAPLPLMSLRTESLFGECAITDAVLALATAGIEQRGAIFTRREVVEFILDLTGYTTDRPLNKLRLLEPSFGDGDFLVPAIDRLLEVWIRAGRPDVFRALGDAVRAVELHRVTFENTRRKVIAHLKKAKIAATDAEALVDQWLIYGDFLLISLDERFDVVIGNPPYVRQELIADALMSEYRARYSTIYDRADIYIPFIERGLDSLNKSARFHLRRSLDEEPLWRASAANGGEGFSPEDLRRYGRYPGLPF